MHSTGTGQPVETQDVFFWRLAGRSAPTGLAIVHWIGCINAIKYNCCHGTGCCQILHKYSTVPLEVKISLKFDESQYRDISLHSTQMVKMKEQKKCSQNSLCYRSSWVKHNLKIWSLCFDHLLMDVDCLNIFS